jgi:hypothetical protein
MLNWPNYGNDIYLNIVELNDEQREKELLKAKEQTLRFVYFIQNHLGFKNLGLADDEFPTKDRLALMPYHREGRRLKGLVRFTIRNIAEPFTGDPLYRTGISVGDYPIDHHHQKNLDAPQHLEFYPVPSYNIPLGSLIPQQVNNLIVAEKGISVSNVANGATRLQPVVLLTGQAAGMLASLSEKQGIAPKQVSTRDVQQSLLSAKAYIMPYIDIQPGHPHFEAIQKIGATGILKGKGIPFKWANQTWFYPDSVVMTKNLMNDLQSFSKIVYKTESEHLSIKDAINIVHQLSKTFEVNIRKTKDADQLLNSRNLVGFVRQNWSKWGLKNYDITRKITRSELAVLLNNSIDPFTLQQVDHKGYFKKKETSRKS